nr:protein gone early [Leptinotarsa decemlineata]
MKQQLVRRETERVRDMIATLKLPLRTSTVEWKLKHLYEGCVDVDTLRVEGERPLKDIINELGGWYILRDFNDADFDKNEVIKTLQVKHGVTPYFKISVQPNPNMPGQNIIRISPSGLGLPDKEYYYRDQDDPVQIAYREYIRDVVIYMSTARNEATKFGTDMFFYEKRIAEITPDTMSLQNPITTYNAISLSELRDTNSIPFFDILQAMYPDSNITDNTEVIVSSLEYLGQISQIIATTDRKTMNGYLTWTLVRHYIPYLSSTYTSALDTFTSALYGMQQPLERWEMCAGLVRRFMGFAVNYFEEKNHPITKNSMRTINDTFASIVSVVKNKIETFPQTSLLYNHLKSKLSTLSLQVGIPENTKEEKYLKDYYLKLKILKSNLFDSVQNSVGFQKKLEERRLNKSPVEDSILSYVLAEVPVVEYSPADNAVIIPRILLTEPFFEENYPSSIIYGRLGVEIAEAVVSSIFPYDSLWTSDRKILSPYHMTVEESIKSVQPSLKCIESHISNSNWNLSQVASNETALKTLIHVMAVDVAKQALISSLEQTEHTHQPSLERYEDTALFFIAYSQTQCSESTTQQQLYENIVNFELPQYVR